MRPLGALAAVLVALLVAGVSGAQDDLPPGARVGTQLPPLAGVDLEGRPSDLRGVLGRSTVVLSFWSIHCRDCIRELDDLRSIRREFPADQVVVVAVNTDSGLPVNRIEGFVRRYEAARGDLGVVHLVDRDATILEALGVRFIPLLVVADRTGRVSSVLTGYSPEDRGRVAQAMDQGRVALGAWGEGLRGRLRTVLRSAGPGGAEVEWGSFRVEEGLPLFGLYDSRGWLADAAGQRDRAKESQRVEAAVAEHLKVALLSEALASVGVRLPLPGRQPFRPGGIEVPEGPFQGKGPWRALYEALRFDELVRVVETSAAWVGDDHWAGIVGDVDLGKLRVRLEGLALPTEPRRIRLETVSDFDYKPRALLQRLRQVSYRLAGVQDEYLVYHGDPDRLVAELLALEGVPFRVYAEVLGPREVRVEIL